MLLLLLLVLLLLFPLRLPRLVSSTASSPALHQQALCC
jgi:Sec-independent protein translocase protein TatA